MSLKRIKNLIHRVMKKSLSLKKQGAWLFVAGVALALIIALIAGLHYFGKI
jgi:hypothetical protein